MQHAETADPPHTNPLQGGLTQAPPPTPCRVSKTGGRKWPASSVLRTCLLAASLSLCSSSLSPLTAQGPARSSTQPTRPICSLTPGESDSLLIIGTLIDEQPAPGTSALLLAKGRVVATGAPQAIAPKPTPTTYDCGSSYISPGFINPHEHLHLSGGFPDYRLEPVYSHRDEWRGKAPSEHPELSYRRSPKPIHRFWIELRHLLAGTTTLASAQGVRGLAKNAGPGPRAAGYTYRLDMETFPYGLAATKTFGDGSCKEPANVPEPKNNSALVHRPYVPHVAEGTNCVAELEGKAYLDYVSRNPGRRYSLIHGLGLNQSDGRRLEELDVTLIWSPRSNLALYGQTAPIPTLRDAGVRVAISTDWSHSGSFNMLEEIRCADQVDSQRWDDRLSGRDYWLMATAHAAYALGLEDKTGKLEPGLAGDVVVLRNNTDDPFRDLLRATVDDVIATFVDGELASGHYDGFDRRMLPEQCRNDLGDRHFVCADYTKLQRDYGFGHDKLVRANAGTVPLFNADRQAPCEVTSAP